MDIRKKLEREDKGRKGNFSREGTDIAPK